MSRPIDKEWMNATNRNNTMYRAGAYEFVEFARENIRGVTTCPCPCKKCRNRSREPFQEVYEHLVMYGMDQSYCFWALHGEKLSQNQIGQTMGENVGEGTLEVENNEDGGPRLGGYVDDVYEVYEGGLGGVPMTDNSHIGASGESHVEPNVDGKYLKYKKKAEEKLYPSCEGPHTTLSVIVELHNLKKEFGWSGRSVTALLIRLIEWFPEGNTLPDKYPEMKKMLKDLGMKATRIDACANNCILYWKNYQDATECPQCKMPRYKVQEGNSKRVGRKESKEANKVLRHFPLAPRFKKLYTIPWITHAMTWHDRAKASWDVMRHPIDASQWRKCKTRYPTFAEKDRNVWLAVATDGFNPRGIQSTSYSCWPVILVPYNLPPSLCMKREFYMLSVLIPGPKAPGQSIDVFLEPLIDELIELWEKGVDAYDMHRKDPFTLKAMLMWGIHDFPAYGNLSGCVTHGYKACPVCGDDIPSMLLETCRKIVYPDYTMFLRMDHPFRDGKFLRQSPDSRAPPTRLSGQELLRKFSPLNFIPGKVPKSVGRKRKKGVDVNEDNEDDEEEVTGAWYKKSMFYKLVYWPGHQVRNVIDVMHVEKNVAEHILNTILDKKDTSKDISNAKGAPYLLNKEEKRHFCQILKDLKLPTHFSSNLSNIVTIQPPGLLTMKSHDYHVILQYLLLVLIQHAFPKHRDLQKALHQISLFFNLICSKVIVQAEIVDAKFMVAEALCVLRKHFPLSFFDISIHLMVHLADEALICGPARDRWMFPFERSMKDFKNIPSNKRYVEGSIVESYLVSESVRYAMEYMPNPRDGNHKSTHESFLDEDGEYSDEGPLLDGKVVTLQPEQFIQIRRLLVQWSQVVRVADQSYILVPLSLLQCHDKLSLPRHHCHPNLPHHHCHHILPHHHCHPSLM